MAANAKRRLAEINAFLNSDEPCVMILSYVVRHPPAVNAAGLDRSSVRPAWAVKDLVSIMRPRFLCPHRLFLSTTPLLLRTHAHLPLPPPPPPPLSLHYRWSTGVVPDGRVTRQRRRRTRGR